MQDKKSRSTRRDMLRLIGGAAILSGFRASRAAGNELEDELDLGAMVQPPAPENKFALPDYFVWCGAPAKGTDGKYHLFYSRWPVKAGFAPGWAIHSEIAYAVSDRPLGPYKHVNVALPTRGREFVADLKSVLNGKTANYYNLKFVLCGAMLCVFATAHRCET